MDLNPFSAIRTLYPTSSPKWVKYSRLAYCWQNNPPPPPPQKKKKKKREKKRRRRRQTVVDSQRRRHTFLHLRYTTAGSNSSVQSGSRWYLCTRKSPYYALHPVRLSVVPPIVAFDKIPLHDGAFSVLLWKIVERLLFLITKNSYLRAPCDKRLQQTQTGNERRNMTARARDEARHQYHRGEDSKLLEQEAKTNDSRFRMIRRQQNQARRDRGRRNIMATGGRATLLQTSSQPPGPPPTPSPLLFFPPFFLSFPPLFPSPWLALQLPGDTMHSSAGCTATRNSVENWKCSLQLTSCWDLWFGQQRASETHSQSAVLIQKWRLWNARSFSYWLTGGYAQHLFAVHSAVLCEKNVLLKN